MMFTPPNALGSFQFPPPWNSQGIRVTNASNAPQGCEPRAYSYWSTINHHRGRPDLYVFVQRKGLIPIVLKVQKATGQVSLLRELPWAGVSSGEGSYFSDSDPVKLFWLAGNELRTTNVEMGEMTTVFSLDPKLGGDLWQAHSSADDTVHAATARRRTTDGPYEALGAVVYTDGQQRFFPTRGNYDECSIDKSGRWLIIQEDNDNRIIDLTGAGVFQAHTITNAEGALGHLDVGDGFMVGEDDSGDRWQMTRWDLGSLKRTVLLIGPAQWGSGMGHLAVRGGTVLLSSNTTSELYVMPADGSGPDGLRPGPHIIAPGLIDGRDYDHQLRACLDPTGTYAAWVAELEGRLDLLLVQVPDANAPPIIVRPPDPKPPGGQLVPGSQPYPDEPTWWTAVLDEIGHAYEQQGEPFNLGMFKWSTRIAYDIGIGMDREQSRQKHLAEMLAELGR